MNYLAVSAPDLIEAFVRQPPRRTAYEHPGRPGSRYPRIAHEAVPLSVAARFAMVTGCAEDENEKQKDN